VPPLNHDVAAVPQFAQRWLAEEHLYSELIAASTPLIFVLNLIPACIAGSPGWIPSRRCGSVCSRMAGSAGGSLCGCAIGPQKDPERAFLDVLSALFVLDASYDFGRPEHLMAVAALA
jgi:hypothetical protein